MFPSEKGMKSILKSELVQSETQTNAKPLIHFPSASSFRNVFDRITIWRFNLIKLLLLNRKVNKGKHLDYGKSICDEIIKTGFNTEADQANHEFKITSSNSKTLLIVLYLLAFFESQGLSLKEQNGEYLLKSGGKYHDITNIIEPKTTDRVNRLISKSYKASGYSLHHVDTIVQVAERWYQCRVVHGSIKKYCDSIDQTGIVLDPYNISNEIKICDKAMGYPRSKS
jgi:hypothetical protein